MSVIQRLQAPQNWGRTADLKTYQHGARSAENPVITREEADLLFADFTFPVWTITGTMGDYLTYFEGQLYKIVLDPGMYVRLFKRNPTQPTKVIHKPDIRSTGWKEVPLTEHGSYSDETMAQLIIEEIQEKLPTMLVLALL